MDGWSKVKMERRGGVSERKVGRAGSGWQGVWNKDGSVTLSRTVQGKLVTVDVPADGSMTTRQAAHALGVSQATIYRWIDDGWLQFVWRGHVKSVTVPALRKVAAERGLFVGAGR